MFGEKMNVKQQCCMAESNMITGIVQGIGGITAAVNHKKTREKHAQSGSTIVDPETGMLGGWMSKRAKEKGAGEKSAIIRDYYWKPRYFRQTDENTIQYCVDKDPTSAVKGEFKLSEIQYLKIIVFSDGTEKFNIGWMGPNGTLERIHLRVPGRAMLDPWVCNLIVRCKWLSNNKPLEDDAKLFLSGSITMVDWARHARVAKKGLLLKAYNGPMTSSDIANHDRKLQEEDEARIRNCRRCRGTSQIPCHFCNGTAWNNGRECCHCLDRSFRATGTERCPACLPTEYT
eukprot:TRINITY_DN2170_c0_g1_i1.p1 TRINITY_DN2170_c0_g1~~TRINITY_DN2170_c0_g1_i1.p1  ORF type:complete len:287 (-),score=37.94 TRINITY_DN2170_c0_g1_i1:86-946(-)